MIEDPRARMAGVLGGLAVGLIVVLAAGLIAAVARPPLWLEILIILWATPPAMVGIGCALEIVAILSKKLFDEPSTWKWMDPPCNGPSRQTSR